VSQAEITFGDRTKISWVTTIAFSIFHVFAVMAFFYVDWGAIALAAALHWLAIGWGIGLGYHRLHTHRSYSAPRWFEYFLAVCGTLALEGGPMFWVAAHRIHHKYSDQEGDPHTPRDGKWWAHMLWTIFGESKHADTAMMGKYAPDLYKDPFYRWLTKYHWVPLTTLGLAIWAIGGLPYLLWCVFFRVVFGLHATWLVNSATHLWGTRRFHTRDDSKNSWWVALLTFGEGWHNNHHAHPASARHGMAWYELDITWLTIRLLGFIGFVKDIKLPAKAQLELMQMTFEERKAA
jgi:stearoyl-CoA desaturase (delta-9 desaturase)